MSTTLGLTEVYDSSWIRIYWNGSATFNVYSKVAGLLMAEDCFTVYGVESTEHAMQVAYDWAWKE